MGFVAKWDRNGLSLDRTGKHRKLLSRIVVLFCQGLVFLIHWQELIFGKGMRTATFQFSESDSSVNGPNLFTEWPFL